MKAKLNLLFRMRKLDNPTASNDVSLSVFTPFSSKIFQRVFNGILLPKFFWPTVRKNCSRDREKLLKFEAEGREFAKFLRLLEQFIQTVISQNNL